MKVGLSHKGWFGICPVHVGDIKGHAPFVIPRHWVFYPVFWLGHFAYWMSTSIIGGILEDYKPPWPVEITGRINPIRWVDFKESEAWEE